MPRAVASRPLHFIWLVDASGSMRDDGKIQAVNNSIRDTIPLMRQVADDNPNARVLVRAVAFSSGARWHVEKPTPLDDFSWQDVGAGGLTDLGKALRLVAAQLAIPPMEERALPPVLVLLSDGQPTDDYKGGLEALLEEPWGRSSVRIGIAIGRDVDLEVLQEYIGDPAIRPLQANNPEALVRSIRWASTAVLKAVSQPSRGRLRSEETSVTVPLPTPVTVSPSGPSSESVW